MGFVPPNATNVERGPGFVSFEKGGQQHIAFPNRQNFTHRVAKAIRYAEKSGGDLPQTAFWDKVADVYDDNARLFKKEHQCRPLLKLLRRDEAFDRENPKPVPAPPTSPIPGFPTSPGLGSGGEVSPGLDFAVEAVPEPASGLMLGLGVLVTYVVSRRGIGRRANPA